MSRQTQDFPAFAPEKTRCAIYPGTFDPITNGHLDIIRRALCLFEKVTVLIAVNTAKKPLFDLDERRALIRACFDEYALERITIDHTEGLLVDYAVQHNISVIIRGLRAVSDFDYELQLALMNRRLRQSVDTVFLMTAFRWIYISSSAIKDAARFGGDVSGLVPPHVEEALKCKFQNPRG